MFEFKSIVALALVVSQPAVAGELKHYVSEHDGQHFAYTTELRHGAVNITGHVVESGANFSFDVSRRGWVTGEFDSTPVEFPVAAAEAAQLFKDFEAPEVASSGGSQPK